MERLTMTGIIIRLLFGASILALMSGCQTDGASACDGWRKITLTKHDAAVISDKLANGLLAHNEFGRKIGCW
jgi:hypothetical protein